MLFSDNLLIVLTNSYYYSVIVSSKTYAVKRLNTNIFKTSFPCKYIGKEMNHWKRSEVRVNRPKSVRVTLDNAPSGLAPGNCELEGFEIAGADKKFYPAKARIAGRTRNVEVWSDQVAQPVAVRYAFRNYVGNITLRNTFGIAAFPFRTDTWDDVK